jgi:hypothetical protein
VDGRPDHCLGIFGRPLIQVDTQFDRSVRREFLSPTDDEFFCVVIQILFNERRRVHRIEELVRIAQFQAYDVGVPSVRRSSFREPKTHTRISSIFGFEGQARFRDHADVF